VTPPEPDRSVPGAFLFTDVVGFTEFTEAFGDAAAVDVLDLQAELIEKAVADGPARVVKELGDGAMLWFGEAGHALSASVTLSRQLADARLQRTMPLAVRMGLHHGSAVARGGDLVGHTVNVAARISALAGPGELLVSDDVVIAADRIPDAIRLEPVGPVPVRGVERPIWLHRASGGL
jgi:adenylate cyclase